MKIDHLIAQEIVESLKDIINQDINFIDTDSRIVASTDINRIGEYHEASLFVVMNNEPLVINGTEGYQGTRPGINLPVNFDGAVAGVIGITGPSEEVEPFGKVIKRMTEIMLYQSYSKKQSLIRSRAKRQIIEEALFSPIDQLQSIVYRANLMDVSLEDKHCIAVIEVLARGSVNEVEAQHLVEEWYDDFKLRINSLCTSLTSRTGNRVIVLFNETKIDQVKNNLLEAIVGNDRFKIYAGIGGSKDSVSTLRESYQEAMLVLRTLKSKETIIKAYDDLDMELIVASVPDRVRDLFIEKVFGGFPAHELTSYLELLQVYFDNDGSISKAADELFVHKNTLQYKLNKIYELTGYNPRSIEGAFVLKLALEMHLVSGE